MNWARVGVRESLSVSAMEEATSNSNSNNSSRNINRICGAMWSVFWRWDYVLESTAAAAAVDVISALPFCSSSSQSAHPPPAKDRRTNVAPPPPLLRWSPAVQLLMTLVLNFPMAILFASLAKFLSKPGAHMLWHLFSLFMPNVTCSRGDGRWKEGGMT